MSFRDSRIALLMIVPLAAGAAACSQPAAPPSGPQAASAPAHGAAPDAGGSPGLASSHEPMVGAAGSPHGGDGSPHGMLTWDAPEGWAAEQPSNSMRMAQYRLPASGGDSEDGECVVFYFGPGQGGDAPSNVSRWVSMFSTPDGGPVESKVSEQKIGEKLVTRIEAVGTYHPTAMMMGGEQPPAKPGSMLLGAIVPGADANWFFRCTGPEKTIAANRAAFDGFIASVK